MLNPLNATINNRTKNFLIAVAFGLISRKNFIEDMSVCFSSETSQIIIMMAFLDKICYIYGQRASKK